MIDRLVFLAIVVANAMFYWRWPVTLAIIRLLTQWAQRLGLPSSEATAGAVMIGIQTCLALLNLWGVRRLWPSHRPPSARLEAGFGTVILTALLFLNVAIIALFVFLWLHND